MIRFSALDLILYVQYNTWQDAGIRTRDAAAAAKCATKKRHSSFWISLMHKLAQLKLSSTYILYTVRKIFVDFALCVWDDIAKL